MSVLAPLPTVKMYVPEELNCSTANVVEEKVDEAVKEAPEVYPVGTPTELVKKFMVKGPPEVVAVAVMAPVPMRVSEFLCKRDFGQFG